jgi:restriction system protein
MARRRGLMASLAQIQRDAARAEAARQRAHAASRRAAEQARARYERAAAADERERKRLYAESRMAEVAAMNAELTDTIAALDGVLAATLDVDNYFDLDQLKRPTELGRLAVPEQPPSESSFLPAPPTGLSRMLGGAARHEEQLRAGRARYQQACAEHAERERSRRAALAQVEAENQQRAQEVEALRRDLAAAVPQAVVTYIDLVLNASPYPDGFPAHWRLAYVPESRQLVIEYDLPGIEVIPTVKAYRYVKASDTITETARPQSQVKAQYASVIAQTALRVVDEIFEADRAGHIDAVVLNGMVDTTDPATGRSIRPCLLTLRTTRETFGELDLRRVDPAACLRHLGAGVSRNPEELAPVRPVLEFDMVDPRFIEETDIIGGLDERPNLLAMSPTEFEGLIQNLFSRMGLDTRQTRAARDGGVDCVAFDPRPIMGGKVVIQAKRYKNTVGVSAVRDLFGTLQNEGASKGILVTTSGYGKASFDFATGKPIELLDGANLLYLLREHAGIEARIEAPQDWRDPAQDRPPTADEEPTPTPTSEQLRAGQNVVIAGDKATISVGWRTGPRDLDSSALLLGGDGRVRSDADFIFYNQPSAPDGSVQHIGKTPAGATTSEGIDLGLDALATDVDRVVIAVSVDGGTFADVHDLRVTVTPSGSPTSYAFVPTATVETALVCAEIYRRNGQWRLRAVGQGYSDGLAGLARDFGVDVS